MASPFDPDTHFLIEASESPVTVDGYARGEPKRLSCPCCDAEILLDEDASTPGVDDMPHETDCPQRFVRSEWWRAHVER